MNEKKAMKVNEKTGMRKKEWLETQPNGQKRAEQIRVSRYPHVVTEVSVLKVDKRTGLHFADRSICTTVRPNRKAAEKRFINKKAKKAGKKKVA